MIRLTFVFLALLILSCGGSQQAEQRAGGQSANSQAATEKLNSYVAVGNYIVAEYKGSSFTEAMEKFEKVYGSKEKPNLKQSDPQTWLGNNYNWGLQMAVDPALEVIDKLPAMEGLDELQRDLCLQIKKTNAGMDAFLSYYKQKEFLSDDYAGAEKMHAQIIDDIALTYAKHQTATMAMESWIAKREEQDLIALKEDQKIRYHLKYSLMQAEKIMEDLRAQRIGNGKILSFNTTDSVNFLAEVKKSSAELSRLLNDESEVNKSGISTMSPLKRFGSELDEFIGHVNLLFSKIKKKEAFSESDLKYMSQESPIGKPYAKDGSVNALFNSINEMIDAYNYIS